MSRSQSGFTLCGGSLKRSSFGFTRVCSVNEVDLERVREAVLPPPPIEGETPVTATVLTQSFVWKDINSKYSSRPEQLTNMNLYKYASLLYTKKPIIPQFCGYPNHPTWPPTEHYSKWMLTFYKPWFNNVEELKLPF